MSRVTYVVDTAGQIVFKATEEAIGPHRLSGWTTLPSRLLDMPEGYPLDIKWLPDGSALLMEWLTRSANPKPHTYRQTVPPVEPMIREAMSPDFRNISWGMTVEEAVAAEKDAVLHQR